MLVEQDAINKDIARYCKEKQFEMVWFNKTIEHVFIGKLIKKEKNNIAKDFVRKQLINKVDINRLNKSLVIKHNQGESNLKKVIDKLLSEK